MGYVPPKLRFGETYSFVRQTKNDVVIWDRIIRRKEDAVLNVKSRNKYEFKDVAVSFKCVITNDPFSACISFGIHT